MQQIANVDLKNKHPLALWCLASVDAFYCFGFGMITSLLVLYLTESLHISQATSYNIFAAMMSLLFTVPLIGGYLAGKLGYKYAAVVGLVVALAGTLILCIHSSIAMFVGVSAFVVGNGLFTPATYSLIGLSYAKHDVRRDSGYTIFYLLFNIGFLISSIAGGFIATYIGYNVAFLISVVALLIALIILIFCLKLIQPAEGSSMLPQVSWQSSKIVLALIAACVIGVPICVALLEHVKLDNALLWILTIGACVMILWYAKEQKDKFVRYRLIAFLILSIISVAFWSLYMLEPSLLTIFIEKNVDRTFGSFTIPPSTYYSLDAFFVITLGIFFSWLWHYLSHHNKDVSLPTKFASSLIAMGVGYLVIVLGIALSGSSHLTSSFWIVLAYIFFASAELLISPIGLSMVGRLMPAGKDGLGMGIWQLFCGLSAIISGYLANMAVVPASGTPLTTNPIFASAITKIGLGTVIAGIVAALLIPKIKKLLKY